MIAASNDLFDLIRALPLPVLIFVAIFVFGLISSLLQRKPIKPTMAVEQQDLRQRMEQLRQGRRPQSARAASKPPALPNGRSKAARKRQQQLAAQAAGAQLDVPRPAPVAARSPEPTAAPSRPATIAGNARTFFARGGLRDGLILSEILGPPKSMR